MSHENQNEIDFDGLQDFLREIGFDQSVKINNSLAFHHRESGAIITLTVPTDGRTVRPADLLSISMRLEAQGLASETVLDQIKSGKLPVAS